jgi:hypothetical protein
MRRRLRLVSSKDPADVFDDLNRLRQEQRGERAPQKRQRSAETFARIPHDRALELYRHQITGSAWILLIELDRLILKRRGKNPVRLNSSRLRNAGIRQHTRQRALRQLEAAGVIKIRPQGGGLAPWVTHLWYPLQD